MKKILIVAAHADDEVLGCGGTIAKLINYGCRASTLILCDGVSSRENCNRGDQIERENQSKEANKIIGIGRVANLGLPDNKLDTLSLLQIVKEITPYLLQSKPEMIFTHYGNDLNIDHRITYQAVLTATRPMAGESVKAIFSFEVASSTEWNYPLSFMPDTYSVIDNEINLKLKAMEVYKDELREYPHPRSLKGIELQAQNWGMRVGVKYAEAFQTVRNLI